MPRETWSALDGHRYDRLGSREWALKTSIVIDEFTKSGQRYPAPAVLVRPDFWNRPPMAPPLAGWRATAGGRGHRRVATGRAQARRRRLALDAYKLRTEYGLTIREISCCLGVSKTTVGRWLYGVRPNGWNLFGGRRVTSRWDGTSNRARQQRGLITRTKL